MSMVITGVSSGIGKYLCEYYLEQGLEVIGVGRSKPEFTSEKFHFVQQDLTDLDKLEALGKELEEKYSPSSFIHNSMYTPGHKPFLRYKADDFIQAHKVCTIAPTLLLKKIAMGMKSRGHGRIIFMGSAVQLTGAPGQLVYLTAKSALSGLTKGLSIELALSKITVNQILLGPVETEKLKTNVDEERRQRILNSLPTQEFVSMEQISHVINYILSPESASYTGQELVLSSGLPGRRS